MEENRYIKNTDILMNIVSQQLLHSKSPVQLFLFEGLSCEENIDWVCLTESKEGELLSCLTTNLNLKGRVDMEDVTEKHIVYFRTLDGITDSRCNGYGKPVKTAWIFVADEDKYTYRIMSQVLMRIIVDRLTDLLYLEEVVKKLESKNLFASNDNKDEEKNLFASNDNKDKEKKKIKQALEDNIIAKYCDKLLNREWLLSKYVSFALSERELPESEMLLQLSALRYETRESNTRLYFGEKEKTHLKLKFSEEMLNKDVLDFKPDNYRTIRKMMELAGDGYGLMIDTTDTNTKKVCGVLSTKEHKIPECYVQIEGYLHWSLNIAQEKIFEYSNGTYSLLKNEEQAVLGRKLDELKNYLIDENWVNSEEQADKIISCLYKIKEKATHGASVVFGETDLMREKAEELSNYNRAYMIEVIDEEEKTDGEEKTEIEKALEVSGLTSIDGAIIADFDCKCISIGAILDGKTLLPGNAGRGARYNSITNYVRVIAEESTDNKCFAAIFSEDRTVDFACVSKESEKIKIIGELQK